MVRVFIAISLILLGSESYGADQCVRDPGDLQRLSRSIEEAQKCVQVSGCPEIPAGDLIRAMSSSVRYLSREITIYRWATRSELGSDPRGSEPFVASSDPLDVPDSPERTLVTILLHPGERFIAGDLREALPHAVITGLRCLDPHCPAKTLADLSHPDPGMSASCPKALELWKTAARELGVKAIATDSGKVRRIAACTEDHHASSFLVLDPLAISPDSVRTLSAEIPEHDTASYDRSIAHDLFMASGKSEQDAQVLGKISTDSSKVDVGAWARQHLFGCDPALYSEDIPAGDSDHLTSARIKKEYAEISRRANEVSRKLQTLVKPAQIKEVISRRFINRYDWMRYREKQEKAGAAIDPKETYQPAPTTWTNWQQTTEEQVQKQALSLKPVTLAQILRWNKSALVATLPSYVHGGKLKDIPNFGSNVMREDALSSDEIQAIREFRFTGEKEPALEWTPLYCRDELPARVSLPGPNPQCQAAYEKAKSKARDPFWAQTKSDLENGLLYDAHLNKWYWYACWPRLPEAEAKKRTKNCGMIRYSDPKKAKGRLENLLRQVNTYLKELAPPEDPIDFAAHVERQLVAIHPFTRGNGRAARWMMDFVTTRSGVPPILVPEMDRDLSTFDEAAGVAARQGLAQELRIMDRCIKRYEAATTKEEVAAIQKSECGQSR
ncbi:MAG: Fic family protein [Bdellovibrionota bacterium]